MTGKESSEYILDLGKRLRSLRTEVGFTLRRLAEESGVAFGTIQKIESGAISPTVGILLKIARGLGVRITTLLEEGREARSVQFTARNKRMRASDEHHKIEVQYIAQNLINPEMYGFHLTVEPGEGSGEEPLLHGGEEIVIGLQGTITFFVGEEQYSVGPGDCLHFKCNISHRWLNCGSKPARFYYICSESNLPPAPPTQI
jgi:transcriptional regulator with XRE-family HTH domain